ncbi:hypothetical protein J2X66_005986, partial [Pseudomonas sp. 3296]|uniref:Ig-like domain-containing protein n=1 Tax=Pseudomonas sp. 3296 TaxID=2817753 RepID=UPI00285E12D3
MTYVLIQQLPRGVKNRFEISSKEALKIKAQRGAHYELIDTATGKAPEGLRVKHKGNALELEVDGEKVVYLEGFYDADNVPCYLDIHPLTGDQELVTITQASLPIDGDSLLYGAEDDDRGLGVWGVLGAAGGAGLALWALNSDDDGHHHSQPPVKTKVIPPSAPAAIDTAAPGKPVAPSNYADNVGDVQDVASTAPTTDDTTPGLNVGAGLTDTPKLYVDGVEVPATYDPVSGTLTPDAPLADGSHELSYTLTDAAGNES